MSFGPERAGRRTASVDSPIARTTRRILLTGGCAFAGWIGASALGGAAHAATAGDAAPVSSVLSSSVLNSVSATSQQVAGGATQHLSHDTHLSVPTSLAGIHRSVDTTVSKTAIGDTPVGSTAVAKALGGKRPASITIRAARSATDLPGAPKPSSQSPSGKSSADKSADEPLAGIGDALSSGDKLGSDVDSRLHALDPAVKPVTDKVITPITSKIKPTTDQIVTPVTDRVVKPVTDAALHAAQAVVAPGGGSGALAGLGGTLDSLTGHQLPGISLPGLTETGPQQPAPIALNPRPIELPGSRTLLNNVVRSGTSSTDRAGRTATSTVTSTVTKAAHPTAAHRAIQLVLTPDVPAQRLLPAYATAVAGSGSQHNPIAVSGASRAPNGPVAPTAPQLPTGASTGSAPGSSLNNSGPTGGSPVALDADADAPFRALGTVDPTDASMARSVAKRPSTSPD